MTGESWLNGKRALVTGGAAGIGAESARLLASRGADVIVADYDGDAAVRLAEELGGKAWQINLLGLPELSDGAITEAVRDIDILVNNAGVQRISALEKFGREDFRQIITLMLEVPFLLARAALPGMYEREWGRIINISSVHGHRASPYKSAYVAAKHGLEGLSKVIALESAEWGVTSNCVSPGYVRTDLVIGQIEQQAVAHGMAEEEVIGQVMLAESAIKRLVEPEEVAELVTWLASPAAAMVTGASYTIDGGWSAH
ncbi:MAG: 3-hydroxybutyrate dehydrogenase [Leucobacter sp.]